MNLRLTTPALSTAKPSKLFFLTPVLFLVAFSIPAIQGKKSDGASWAIKGDYLDACSCEFVCMCSFGVDPQTHNCQGVNAIRVKEGRYGDISLTGLTAAVYIKPGVEWGLYIDEDATEAQQERLTKILKGILTEAGTYLGMKPTRIKYTTKSGYASLEIPGVMRVEAERMLNNKKPITVTNGHNPLADRLAAGRATLNEFNDFSKAWKYEGRNAWLGSFDKSGIDSR